MERFGKKRRKNTDCYLEQRATLALKKNMCRIFLKINKRTDPNNQAGGIFFGKLISEQALITMSRLDFCEFINKRPWSSIRNLRVNKQLNHKQQIIRQIYARYDTHV